ncbi:prolyl oligopeptidase family serine peptidase [Phenylobacterium aquaticum]|uniref:S9 family peptidase n=1 Tax=Phenylobacterium aquaticum TaxID=1763816 RepID=UPI0026F35327|nr:prolyl oligopeptidase family serine peptidase [Phenylobacterium aquaticum]
MAAVLAAFGLARAQAAPLEAYGRLPDIEDLAISPDGERLAVILTADGGRKIIIRRLSDGAVTSVEAGPQKVRSVDWAGPDHLLITTSTTGAVDGAIGPVSEYFGLFDLDIPGRRLKPLMRGVKDGINIIVGRPMIRVVDGQTRVFVRGVDFFQGYSELSLFEIDLATSHAKLVQSGHSTTIDWLVAADGSPLAEALYNQAQGIWTLRLRQGADWREAATLKAPFTAPWILGLGKEGASVLVSDRQGGDVELREISAANPAWPAPFFTAPNLEALYDPLSGRFEGVSRLSGDVRTYEFLNQDTATTWDKILRAYRGQNVTPDSWSADRSRIVVTAEPADDEPNFAMVDLKLKRSLPIGQLYQNLEQKDVAATQPITFKAADGLALSGYLTLPTGRAAHGLPLIVWPHADLDARDILTFDWRVQALASRGYAVLQVNYRGSSGYGGPLRVAGYGQVGRKMQTDLSDGVRDLAARGLVDPVKVCIVGESFGGFMALSGMAFEPGVYRCGVSINGLSDLASLASAMNAGGAYSNLRAWSRWVGAADVRDPVWKSISPAFHADRISAPVLLIQGKDDTIIPTSQGQAMEKALRAAGKSVQMIMLEKEDHWFSRAETRQQMLTSLVAFLEKNNPPN